MGYRAEKIRELQQRYHFAVVRRDNLMCFVCANFCGEEKRGEDIHEVVSRGVIATPYLELYFVPRNMIYVCRDCHDEIQGNELWTGKLLRKLQELHGYEYPEMFFRYYLEE